MKWLVAALAFAFLTVGASAQIALPFPGPGMPAASGGGGSCLLDTLSQTSGPAFSDSRKLRQAYTGTAIQIQRASDSATLDVPFAAGTCPDIDTTAFNAHCAGTNCFVTIRYDQGVASTANATATTTARPRIANAGTMDTLNGHAAARYGLVSALNCMAFTFADAQPTSIAFVAQHVSQTTNGHYTDGFASSPRQLIGVGSGTPPTQYSIFAGTTSIPGGTLDTSTHAFFGLMNGASSVLTVDGTSTITGNPGAAAMSAQVIGAGRGGGACSSMDGYIPEYIVFPAALSAPDQALIRASWQTYWGAP